jgi:UDP-GlcNAc3NAcA epimerase
MTMREGSKTVLTIIGARPQFVKLAPLAASFTGTFRHVIVHTGQHYDEGMSGSFFEELSIPSPRYHLGVGSGSHAEQTGRMLIQLEPVLKKESPDMVVVYGDTNSTLAGALVAAKLGFPIAHVEAGLRSFNRFMPEEINRVVVDRLSILHFCPTMTAIDNLRKEGIAEGVHLVGDVMVDAMIRFRRHLEQQSPILQELQLRSQEYYLATVHRPSNTDHKEHLVHILDAFAGLNLPVLFPLHPRTEAAMKRFGISQSQFPNIRFLSPVGYLDMLRLEKHALMVLTDSGGIQKEAYCLKVPCITLRDETEWVETVLHGWNVLVGSDREKIIRAAHLAKCPAEHVSYYGNGDACEKIRFIMQNFLSGRKVQEL